MAINASYKYVIIDDFIGDSSEASELVQGLYNDRYVFYKELLDLDLIRKSVLAQLKDKEYDLMIFIESGGVYFLAIPEMLAKAKHVISIPVSEHGFSESEKGSIEFPPGSMWKSLRKPTIAGFMRFISKRVDSWVSDKKEIIKASSKIAIVEGDVGGGGYSFARLNYVKDAISKLNPAAKIDVIVGIASTAEEFDILGVYVHDFEKLSDIARRAENAYPTDSNLALKSVKRLLHYWARRKTLPVPKE